MTEPRLRPFPRFSSLVFGLLASLAVACGPAPTGEKSDSAPAGADPGEIRAALVDLINALTPAELTAPVEERNSWYGRRRETLERLRAAGHEYGLAALAEYHERSESVTSIRSGLLDIAAHGAPLETRPILVELVQEYGDDLAVRTRAAELLSETSPETAVEVLEPILLHERTGRTYPHEDQLLSAWSVAVKVLELDPIELLCTVATDLPRDMAVRHLATKLLGETPSVQGRQALEQLIVESTGNHMLRRFAAQSLKTSISGDELCTLLDRIISNESNQAFAAFLDSMRLANCR